MSGKETLIRMTATQNTTNGRSLFEVFTIADRKNERRGCEYLRSMLARRARMLKTQLTGAPVFGELKPERP